MASQSRKASKQYVRERSNILVSAFAKLMDYWRHGAVGGATEQLLWNNKAEQVNVTECVIHREEDRADLMWNDSKCEAVCAQLLKSATKTNEAIDNIAGMDEQDRDSVKAHSHQNAGEL